MTYYDMRTLTPGDTTTLPTDVWLTTSPAPTGGTFSFGNEKHVAGSFNMLVAPFAGGYFVGDYEALSASGSVFMPFFVQTNCADNSCTSNRTGVYTGSF